MRHEEYHVAQSAFAGGMGALITQDIDVCLNPVYPIEIKQRADL